MDMAELERALGDAASAGNLVWTATEADIPRILTIAKDNYSEWIGVSDETLWVWAQNAIVAQHVGLFASKNGFAFGLLQPGPDLKMHARMPVLCCPDGKPGEAFFLAAAVVGWAQAMNAADIYWDTHPDTEVDLGPFARKLGFMQLLGYFKDLRYERCC